MIQLKIVVEQWLLSEYLFCLYQYLLDNKIFNK